MKKHITLIRTLGVLASAVLASGCVSTVTVRPVAEATASGIHYYLPQVFIRLTPGADGNITVDKLFLPDPQQEYVITASSYFGNYTIDVNRSESGMLETVSFNSDGTAVAKQYLASQAAVRATEIDTQVAKDKAAATEAKAAADKAKAALEVADKARKDALLALNVATNKFQLLDALSKEAGAPNDIKAQVLTSRLAVVEAQTKYDAALLAYNTLAETLAAANGVDAKAANSAAGKRPQAPTPVFYKVEMQKDTVVLKEAIAQRDLDTWKVPPPSTPPDPLTAMPVEQVVRPAEKTQALIAKLTANQMLLSAVSERFAPAGSNVQGLQPRPVVSLMSDRVTLVVELPQNTAAGDYDMDITVTSGKSNDPKRDTLAIKLKVVK